MTQANSPPMGHAKREPDAIAPDGSEIRLLIDQTNQAKRASLVEVTLAEGQVSRPVRHRAVEEIWYVVGGYGRVWRCPPDLDPEDTAPAAVRPGDALTIPPGWAFQFSAGREEPLRIICYTSPPWPGPEEAQPVEKGRLGEPTV